MTAVATEVTTTKADIQATVKQHDLLAALKFAAASICNRAPMQVLLGVLIEGNGLWVRVSGFDYEQCTSQLIPGVGSGRALIPCRLAQDLVASFDKGSTIELSVEEDRVVLQSGDTRFNVPTLKLEDYPALPQPATDLLATVPGSLLGEFGSVAIAAGRDQTLPVLTGIRIDTDGDTIEVVATDRYRLARYTTDIKPVTKVKSVLVPAVALHFAAKQFAKEEQVDISVAAGENGAGRITFRASDRLIDVRLLEGEFPKYRMLLPSDFTSSVLFNSKDLVTGVKRAALVAMRHAPVRLQVTPDSLALEAGGVNDAQSCVTLSGAVSGSEIDLDYEIAFNPAYALDGVSSVGGSEVVLSITSPTRPMVWHNADKPQFQYLLMPVRLSS